MNYTYISNSKKKGFFKSSGKRTKVLFSTTLDLGESKKKVTWCVRKFIRISSYFLTCTNNIVWKWDCHQKPVILETFRYKCLFFIFFILFFILIVVTLVGQVVVFLQMWHHLYMDIVLLFDWWMKINIYMRCLYSLLSPLWQ